MFCKQPDIYLIKKRKKNQNLGPDKAHFLVVGPVTLDCLFQTFHKRIGFSNFECTHFHENQLPQSPITFIVISSKLMHQLQVLKD